MQWFKDMKLNRKLYVLLFIVITGFAILETFNIYQMGKVYDAANYGNINSVPSILVLDSAKKGFSNAVKQVLLHILNTDTAKMAEIEKSIKTGQEELTQAYKDYEPLLSDDKDKQMLAEDRRATAELNTLIEKVLVLSRQNKNTDARDLLMKNVALIDRLSKDIDDHIAYNKELADKGSKDAVAVDKRATTLALAVSLLLVAAIAGLSLFITRMVTGQLGGDPKEVREIAKKVAAGDLTVSVNADSRNQDSALWAMKTMAENLRTIVGQVSSTSAQVAAAASQLHSTSERIATGAEEVAAQAATVGTAGEEMSATSGDIARNCQLAAEGAQLASRSAHNGAEVVEKTVAVMGQIADKVQESAKTVENLGARSDQIGEIIGTIEDIADQTNLLALNAAIEAARAGEQGRGFAVVADEVRALAERTTRATKEIGEMIKAIQRETKGAVAVMEQGVQQVASGTAEAANSGEALRDILNQINDVAMQVSQIATAAEEQTATTGEISSNMMQITEVVQQTSLGANESATAAAQLSGNAEELQRLVRQFKI